HFENAEVAAAEYEARIREAGGIDWQLLGIGRDGHVGFNEPGSDGETRTRRVDLADETREDAAPTFGGLEYVPTHAMTMGVGTILEAKRIVLIARGTGKKEIVVEALTGDVGPHVPASYLRGHQNVGWFLDHAAAGIDA
ncbi:6-phosphogluconolactonase, partial [bacterium]|nr:6-phosphogluconolactonase [bacterium]